jgi:hypothetical protein
MSTTKNIQDIIALKNYCRSMIQELYYYESRPYSAFQNINIAKIDEAIQLEIIEHDNFDDELSLSADTEEYYKIRLGQNNETNIGYIDEKLNKLSGLLKTYNIRIKNAEDPSKDIKSIYKLLNQIPSMLRQNLKALSSNSVFAFKNEPNFEIKMMNLEICRKEIKELSSALENVDNIIKINWNFFKNIKSVKINFAIGKIRRSSAEFEKSFARLHGDIVSFINQSIKDGKFIEKMKKLKELKDNSTLLMHTNIEEVCKKNQSLLKIKEKKVLPDDRVYDYIDTIQSIMVSRKNKVINTKGIVSISYDITHATNKSKVLYDYPKLNKEFLAQENDLISFLKSCNIEKEKLLGMYVRLLKNYGSLYDLGDNIKEKYIKIDDRFFLKVLSGKKGSKYAN